MRILTYITLLTIVLITLPTKATELISTAGSDATPWLKKADSYLSSENSEIDVSVKIYAQQKLTKQRQYTVYTQAPRKTIVIFKHPQEKGQKVLMKAHNFWLFLPRSKRGVRITPQQKLFGDAATGDITSIRWSDDYKGKIITCDEQQCQLELSKKHRGPTYAKVVLYVQRDNALPIKSELYLNKNKIAKYAEYFFRKNTDSEYQIIKTEYTSAIRKKQTTLVEFTRMIDKKTPKKWYNPSYLAAQSTLK